MVELQRKSPVLIAVTGGPCAGKSTILDGLRELSVPDGGFSTDVQEMPEQKKIGADYDYVV